jgi:uncharacterized membrane protein YeiB
MLFGFIFGVTIMIFTYLMYVFAISFMLWMLVDAAKQDKFWWLVFMVAVPVIGSIVYFFVERQHDYAKIKRDNPKPETHHRKEEPKEEIIKLAEGEKRD